MQRTNSARWGMFACILCMGISSSFGLVAVSSYGTLANSYLAVAYNASNPMFLILVSASLGSALSPFLQLKLGPKILLLFSLLIQIIAEALLALLSNPLLSAIGHSILGFSLGFIPCAAPTLICCLWRNPQQRSMPLALWSLWIVFGNLLVSVVKQFFNTVQSAFLFAIALNIIAFTLIIVGVRTPLGEQREVILGNARISPYQALINPWSILCFIMVFIFSFGFTTFVTLAPNYFHTYLGSTGARSLLNMIPFIGIIAALMIGLLLRLTRKAPFMLLLVFVLVVIASIVGFYFTNSIMITLSAILFFFSFQLIIPAILINAQWASPDPSVLGSTFGLLSCAFYVGALPAPPIGGLILETSGNYCMGLVPVVVLSLVGLLCAFVFYLARSRYAEDVLS